MRNRNYLPSIVVLLWSALLLLSLSACTTLGYENVDTTRKSILVAAAEVRGANLLLQDLIRRNVIDDDSARQALNNLRIATSTLQTALSAVDAAGDPATAQSNLARANASITVVLTLLSQFEGEP